MKIYNNLNDIQILFFKQIYGILDQGTIPWKQNSVLSVKYNGITGKTISGINRMLLNDGKEHSNCYLSHSQVIKNPINIFKGEISVYNFSLKNNEGIYNRYTRVFHLDQLYLEQLSITLKKPQTKIMMNTKIQSISGIESFNELSMHGQNEVINELIYNSIQHLGIHFSYKEQTFHTMSIANYLLVNLIGSNTLFPEKLDGTIQGSIDFITSDPQGFMRTVYNAIKIVDHLTNKKKKQ